DHDHRVEEVAPDALGRPRGDVVVEVPVRGQTERRGEDLAARLKRRQQRPQERDDDEQAPEAEHDVRDRRHDLVAGGRALRSPGRGDLAVIRGVRGVRAHACPAFSLPPTNRLTVKTIAANARVAMAITTPIALASPNWPFAKAVSSRRCGITRVELSGPPPG